MANIDFYFAFVLKPPLVRSEKVLLFSKEEVTGEPPLATEIESKVYLIKLIRTKLGCGLKEAKDIAEELIDLLDAIAQ